MPESLGKFMVMRSLVVSLAVFALWGPEAAADDRTVVQAWFEAWNSNDPDEFVTMFTENAVHEHVPLNSVSRGIEEIRGFYEFAVGALPDSHFQIVRSSVKGSRATIEWLFTATDTGFYGTGKPFALRGVSVLKLHGRKVARESDYWDHATILRQVGLLPPGL
jgi:steroid delta-isomerase-like uncharacterized protein